MGMYAYRTIDPRLVGYVGPQPGEGPGVSAELVVRVPDGPAVVDGPDEVVLHCLHLGVSSESTRLPLG